MKSIPQKKSFLLYISDLEDLEEDMSTDQLGILFLAIRDYASGADVQIEDPLVRAVFRSIRKQMDRDTEKYEKKVEAAEHAREARRLAKAKDEQNSSSISASETNLKSECNQTKNNTVAEAEAEAVAVAVAEAEAVAVSTSVDDSIIPSAQSSERAAAPEERSDITFKLNDGSKFCPLVEDVKAWEQAYPAIDVVQQLKAAAAWCAANPKNRKTKSGIKRFCVNWLSREQNRARANPVGSVGSRTSPTYVNKFVQTANKQNYDDVLQMFKEHRTSLNC